MIPDAGHAATEPGTLKQLVEVSFHAQVLSSEYGVYTVQYFVLEH